MARVVLDTNVFVSAVINSGKSRKLLLQLLEKHTVISSSQIMAELADVLSRDKFPTTNAQVEKFVSVIVKKAIMVKVDSIPKVVLEDPDDDIILGTALTGKADYVVTGDKHLLSLKKYEKIEILKVNQMIEILS
jgi:putative PIN family toxin of toxin-antitoxin system